MNSQDDLHSQIARSMVLMSAIGIDVAVVLGIGVFLGHLVDTRLGSGPWGLLVGSVLGLVGGGFSAFRLIQQFFR
jgi:F0F1-type ATP synthase assembly protein I